MHIGFNPAQRPLARTLQATPRFGSLIDDLQPPKAAGINKLCEQTICKRQGKDVKVIHFLVHLYEHGAQSMDRMTQGLALTDKQFDALERALDTLHQEGYLGKRPTSNLIGIHWNEGVDLLSRYYYQCPDLNLQKSGYAYDMVMKTFSFADLTKR